MAEREPEFNSSVSKIDIKWSQILVAHEASFNFSDSDQLRAFFLKHFQPKWTPPNADKILLEYVPELAKRARAEMRKLLKESRDWSISVEFDHADLGSKSVLAIMITFQSGKRFLVALEDASTVGKTSIAIITELQKRLNFIPKIKINSFVSDSASAC